MTTDATAYLERRISNQLRAERHIDRNGKADTLARQHAPKAVRRVLELFTERCMSIDAIANEVGTWNYVIEGIVRAEIDRLRKSGRATRRSRRK